MNFFSSIDDLINIKELPNNSLLCADCFDAFPYIKNESIDIILCDLPYGTTQCKWDSILDLSKLWLEYNRIIKNKGAMIFTASQPFTSILVNSNINNFKYSLVWVKSKANGHLDAKRKPMKKHEDIVVFCKNGYPNYYPQGLIEGVFKTGRDKDVTGKIYETYGNHKISTKSNYPKSVLEIANPSHKNHPHPTAKPVELMQWLIEQYSLENDVVLDNTMGSGSTGVACKKTNRQFIGIEKEKQYYDISVKIITEA